MENGMKKCPNCQFNGEEFDGEAIPDGYDGYTGGGNFVGICNKGQTKHYQEGGVNCKKSKEIEIKCQGCKQITPISQLHQGFCSEKCKADFIEHIKESVKNETIRLAEINKRIKELEPVKNIRINEIELMSLKGELQGVEHYLEEGKDILKGLGVVI